MSSEPWFGPLPPGVQPYYDRVSVEDAIQMAREMIEEWDYERDPGGYCHHRPVLVRLVEAAEEADVRRIVLPNEWNNQTVREIERASIRSFVEACSGYLGISVLDYGCGQQPYRDIAEEDGGEYTPFDRAHFPGNVSNFDVGSWPHPRSFDSVLCTQVAQYWLDPQTTIREIFGLLVRGGHLVMTYPTTWAEVEEADHWRYTKAGMEFLLRFAGFEIVEHDERAVIDLGGFRLPLGYGVVAMRP